MSFVMHGAREILDIAGTPPVLVELVEELERAVNKGSPRAFDLAKSLVDSVCQTILNDRAAAANGQLDTPQLFRNTLQNLQLLPADHPDSRAVHEGLTRTVRGLQQSVQGLCELRNREGITSHGPDAYTLSLEPIQILLAARAADTIVHFIYKAHKRYPPDTEKGRLYYEDHKGFNEYVDDLHEAVQIFDLTLLPSQVLFSTDEDQQTYREYLLQYEAMYEELED